MKTWQSVAESLIQRWEGCKLKAYPDPATGDKPYTIGWGHTFDRYGRPIQPGTVWTQAEADVLLRRDIEMFGKGFDRLLPNHSWSPRIKGATVSLIWNIGLGNFEKSTLRKLLQRGDWEAAGKEFPKWVFANGKRMKGLENRRRDEQRVYFGD